MKSQNTTRIGWLLIIYGVCLLTALLVNGCAVKGPQPGPVPTVLHPMESLNKGLHAIDSLMTLVATLSVIAIGVGITLAIYLHTALGPAMAVGGGSMLALSVVMKSVLWFIPWVAGGVLVLGLAAFIVDWIKTGSFKAALLDAEQVLHYPVIKL